MGNSQSAGVKENGMEISIKNMHEPTAARYCIRCGAAMERRFIASEGRERMVCPNCGWVHYPHLKVGAGVLIEQDGKILLVRRAHNPWKGAWNLPAGYVEIDEPPEHAAAREAKEETGLEVRILGIVDARFFNDDPRGNGLLLLYRAEVVGGELRTGDETAELRFFAPDEIPAELAGGAHDVLIRAWQQRRTGKQHG